MSPEETIRHPFEPFLKPDSRILILGSFPSPASRQDGFYYGHPRNRFWRVLAGVYGEPIPTCRQEKEEFLQRNRIALWDVIQCCRIRGASDQSITEAVVNPIFETVRNTGIQKIFLNGKKAEKLFFRNLKAGEIPAEGLPSTSPANAAWSEEKLIQAWEILRKV